MGVALLLVWTCLIDSGWFLYLKWPFGITAGVCWLTGFILFGAKCWGIPGWMLALARHQLWAVPAVAVEFVILCAGLVLSVMVGGVAEGAGGIGVFGLLGFALTVWFLLAVRPMRWLSRHGTAALDPLVHELDRRQTDAGAADIAGRELEV